MAEVYRGGHRIALASGAAAGIAATFQHPLAGVFFALEVILIDFSSRSFGMVVMSSVAANVVARLTLGNDPISWYPSMPWSIRANYFFTCC